MKKTWIILAFVFLYFSVVQATTSGDETIEKIVKVNLTSRLKSTTSKDAGSTFVGLTPQAVDLGMNQAKLIGSVESKALPNKKNRVMIVWHSLEMPSGKSTVTEALASPLTSQFSTGDDKVEPGTILSARGDFEQLTKAFLALKEKAESNNSAYQVLEKESEDDENDRTSLEELAGSGSGSSTAGSSDTQDLGDSDDYSSDMITSTWEKCDPRIAQAEGKVYRQSRRVETNENNEIVDIGECVDYGGSVEIIKEYGTPCSVIYDFENGKVYEQYREYAVVDGEEIAVTNCSNDFEKSYDIYSKTDGCSIRDDFVENKSIVQEKLYYEDNTGKPVQITECIDSDKAYAHFLTELTCTPYIDEKTNRAIIYKRTAYNLDDGTIAYASECRAMDGDGYPLYEAYCDEKYEHDFAAGQSYYRTRDYYINDEEEIVYLTECSRSTETSFPHVYNTADCTLEHYDESLYSVQNTVTQIDTPEDGIIEIAPCQSSGSNIPYTYVGIESRSAEFTSSSTWTVPDTIKDIKVVLVGGGGAGGNGGNRNSPSTVEAGKGWGGSAGSYYNVSVAGGGGGGGAGEVTTTALTVTPGDEIDIIIGGQLSASKFGSLATARGSANNIGTKGSNGKNGTDPDGAFEYPGKGGAGANGYGSVAKAKKGGTGTDYSVFYKGATGGAAGTGYGAGGGGGGGGGNYGGAGGAGASGYCLITWTVNKYRRTDGTYYYGQP